MPYDEWVLVEKFKSERDDIVTMLGGMTAIGPRTTTMFKDAVKFSSRKAATAHPAYAHALSFYEPVPTVVARSGMEDWSYADALDFD